MKSRATASEVRSNFRRIAISRWSFNFGWMAWGAAVLFCFGQAQTARARPQAETTGVTAPLPQRCHFAGFGDLSTFSQAHAGMPNELVLVSPELASPVAWNELIVSWNADLRETHGLQIDVRVIYPERTTKFYTLGRWSERPEQHPRESVKGQSDADGTVETDTLVMKRRGGKVQVRLTLRGSTAAPLSKTQLRFVGVSFLDSQAPVPDRPGHKAAWGKTLPVPERSQLAYAGGEGWCSPTSVSMVLDYWAAELERSDLRHDVPEIARAVFDPVWGGTGNWPFNTAFAGAWPGLRAFVTRLNDLSEIERLIEAGIPVVASVSYGTLKGTAPGTSGHLVVCVGFTPEGDVVVNDPGTRANVRRTFPRQRFVDAWAHSKGTVYLIYPSARSLPALPGFEIGANR